MKNPLVSVVIPTFNRRDFVQKTIKSILAQSYANIEIVVADDGSTDGTGTALQKNYPKVKHYWKENGGCGSALNYGIKKAKGDYICWLSSDDSYYDVKAVEKMLTALDKNKDSMMCYSDFYIDHYNDSPLTTSATKMVYHKAKSFDTKAERYKKNFDECLMNGSTTMFKKEIFKAVGMFNPCYKYCQDWDLWFRILHDYEVAYVPEALTRYSAHINSQGLVILDKGYERERFEREKVLVAKHQRLWLNKGKRPTVCAMLCIKDEEEMIERCLDDINQWADYIVIFDDGSTDKTPELIKQYPKVVNIFTQKNKGNVRTEGKDRQKLLEMAQATKADWLFFIDTDETCEMRFKWDIYDLITDDRYNLYHMREVNLWRGLTHRRVDELYNQGWFARMFRNFPFLKMVKDINEHCCGVPNNIPGAPPWFSIGESTNAKKIDAEMIHYGFAYWERTVKRYMQRMERDPFRFDKVQGRWTGGFIVYERMINETGLTLEPYLYEGDPRKILDDIVIE